MATHGAPETELKEFAEKYADGVINLYALPYTQDRADLYSELSAASVALMPSWHEGFGLVAWEAIAAGVPLILSEQSGVYRLLESVLPGAGPGCVHTIRVRAATSHPFFHNEDLKAVATALTGIAQNPAQARRKAGILRNLLGHYTWSPCVEQAAEAFQWRILKGSIPVLVEDVESKAAAVQALAATTAAAPPIVAESPTPSPLKMPGAVWQPGGSVADSQLLRAEEDLVPFDPARQPDLDALHAWLDDPQWPQAVRLITGAGGLGKTRLALELCRQSGGAGWHTGLLDPSIEPNGITVAWGDMLGFKQPLLIVIDYAETRQTVLLALVKSMVQPPRDRGQTVRVLLLARDAAEWWDRLPSKDPLCEPFLNGYATSGPVRLLALHEVVADRNRAYQRALHAFAAKLGVATAKVVPELEAEHFGRPLYLQMAALLALHGERPTTAEGLTKALLNHEMRYWRGLLAPFGWPEPERLASQLLALATLAGGFATPREARPYWTTATTDSLTSADFTALFHRLAPLYPDRQGLQAVRPDLLGEALVAQALLRAEDTNLLDAVLAPAARQAVRRHGLYEPAYATSLSNYANRLSEVGQSEETRPDRYEPDYAMSLNNYAIRLSEVGQSEEALEHAEQSWAIYQRLAAHRPESFDYDVINTTCSMQFLSWLGDRPATDGLLPDPDGIPPTIRPHRRPELEAYAAFVRGCLVAEHASRRDAFKRVQSAWGLSTVRGKTATRAYWLCAAAWCATHAPDALEALDWQTQWQSFVTQQKGHVPWWMLEVARRLSFRWPQ